MTILPLKALAYHTVPNEQKTDDIKKEHEQLDHWGKSPRSDQWIEHWINSWGIWNHNVPSMQFISKERLKHDILDEDNHRNIVVTRDEQLGECYHFPKTHWFVSYILETDSLNAKKYKYNIITRYYPKTKETLEWIYVKKELFIDSISHFQENYGSSLMEYGDYHFCDNGLTLRVAKLEEFKDYLKICVLMMMSPRYADFLTDIKYNQYEERNEISLKFKIELESYVGWADNNLKLTDHRYMYHQPQKCPFRFDMKKDLVNLSNEYRWSRPKGSKYMFILNLEKESRKRHGDPS